MDASQAPDKPIDSIGDKSRDRVGQRRVVKLRKLSYGNPCRVRPIIVLLKMAHRSRYMSGKTCGCRMSWTYRWAFMVHRINTRCDRILIAMSAHTITPDVGAVCRCKANTGLRRSPWIPRTRTRLSSLMRLNLDLLLKTTWLHSALQSSFLVCDTTPNGGVNR
ncbi:hypothetical protein TNCV_771721 [Trichonephila clavipes]|nr:hypothetical protein TNCV_771721 [Trichonephila clavipes]